MRRARPNRTLFVVVVTALVSLLIVPSALSQPGVSRPGGAAIARISAAPVLAQVIETPTVTVVATDAAAAEAGSDPGTFTVSRTGDTTGGLTVNYTVGGTATSGSDFASLGASVTILGGQASAIVTVNPINDSDPEDDETVIITLTAATGYIVGSPSTATVIIDDNDLPTVTVVATDPVAAEAGSDPGTFTVSRNGPTTATLTVLYIVGGTAGAGDMAALSGSALIPTGQPSVAVTVTPVDDALSEPTETVLLTLSAHPTHTVGTPGAATVNIVDNELAVVTINATDDDASETGPGTGLFVVTRTGDATAPLTVNYTIGGSATNGVDYAALGVTVLIPGGSLSATITITPIDDAVDESDETVALTIVAGAGYTIGSNNSATVKIADNDGVASPIGPLPTSKDQCKKGGWQSFGVFKNQGDCVSFVATGGKNPPNG